MTHTTSHLTIKTFAGKEGLLSIRDHWKTLVNSLKHRRFFHFYEWYDSYVQCLEPRDSSIRFFVVYDNGAPIAIFPLRSGTFSIFGVPVRALELPHNQHMPLCDFIYDPTGPNAHLVALLVNHLRTSQVQGWDVIRLPNLLEDSAALFSLRHSAPPLTILEPFARCDYLPCMPLPDFHQGLSNNFRGNLRKARNKLSALRQVEFLTARTQPHIHQYFWDFCQVEASGWKGKGGTQTAIKLNRNLTCFYQSLLDNFSAFGGCEINLLKIGGKCAAAQLCLLIDDCAYVFKIGHDQEFAKIAPGNMLLERLIGRMAAEGEMKHINLISNSAWHSNWNPQSYMVFNTYIFNPSFRGTSAFLLLSAKQHLRLFYRRLNSFRCSAHESV